jgi:hypothetical protein
LRSDSRLSTNKRRRGDRLDVELARTPGVLAPTALTWAPGASHSRRSTGSRELVTVTTTSAPRTASSALARPTISGAPPAGALDQRAHVRRRRRVHAHRFELPHGEQRLEVRRRLHARADDRERPGVLAREHPRGQRRHRRGADRRDRRRVEDRRRLPGLAVEEVTTPWWASSPRAGFRASGRSP